MVFALTSCADYEQQRQHMLHKHGIDLEDAAGPDTRTRRMKPQDVALLMGGDGQSGMFTWREKHRRKVSFEK
jgi:protein-serine/threonine kinase